MAERYVAAHRIPWGKNHLNPGEELIDPVPQEGEVLLMLLLQSGQVRKERVAEVKAETRAAATYSRRDMTAERDDAPQRPRARRSERQTVEEKPADRLGAMTTGNMAGVSKKPDASE